MGKWLPFFSSELLIIDPYKSTEFTGKKDMAQRRRNIVA